MLAADAAATGACFRKGAGTKLQLQKLYIATSRAATAKAFHAERAMISIRRAGEHFAVKSQKVDPKTYKSSHHLARTVFNGLAWSVANTEQLRKEHVRADHTLFITPSPCSGAWSQRFWAALAGLTMPGSAGH